ncbi:methionyl-tRNA formyltransferase [Marinilabilia rubra]|uniref:Methionyl-tRNA formyltransferase n=1 Tax=Marinilabilia rubra TaxID=2162893 RepID=A0A2U2B7N6_9BACT|nr:methionyl-tRNA formyltransferase [Marinilabilia rubra]PWD99080.1 methionyl-tRNA formyltransferase [Marinilabilia rubra]
MQDLKIVFMGTPDFATESLKALLNAGANVVGVVTAPDKPAGRGRKLTPPPVKQFAAEKGLKVLQPEKLKAPDFLEELANLKADLQVVVAFRMLPEVVWNMPCKGTFNLHASLLPEYRGAAPINWAVINGESKTGVTTFFLKHEIDTGDIIFQEEVAISSEDTAGTVHDKLMVKGAELVVKTVEAVSKDEVTPIPQPEKELKPAPKIFKNDCRIDWQQSAENIYNKIRGLSPYPAAWTELSTPEEKNKSVKILLTEKARSKNLKPGEIFCDEKKQILAGTADEDLVINELQVAGKKRMKTEDFLRGHSISEGSYFV